MQDSICITVLRHKDYSQMLLHILYLFSLPLPYSGHFLNANADSLAPGVIPPLLCKNLSNNGGPAGVISLSGLF